MSKAIANALLYVMGTVALLLLVSAMIGAVRLGLGAALDRLTLLHEIGITVLAVVLGLWVFDLFINSIGRKVLPHLHARGAVAEAHVEVMQAEETAKHRLARMRAELNKRLPSADALEASLASGNPALTTNANLILRNLEEFWLVSQEPASMPVANGSFPLTIMRPDEAFERMEGGDVPVGIILTENRGIFETVEAMFCILLQSVSAKVERKPDPESPTVMIYDRERARNWPDIQKRVQALLAT